MIDIVKAYTLGKRLALHKFAEQTDSKVDALTEALSTLLDSTKKDVSVEVLDSSERAGSSSWGNKIELETPKNTGINV